MLDKEKRQLKTINWFRRKIKEQRSSYFIGGM